MATDNGAVGPEGRSLSDHCQTQFIHAANMGPGIMDIGKNRGRTAKHIFFQGDTLIDGDVVLYLAAIAYIDLRPNTYILPDGTAISDSGAGQDVGKKPDFCARSNGDIFIYHRRRMNVV
jgi:hypothetical protein